MQATLGWDEQRFVKQLVVMYKVLNGLLIPSLPPRLKINYIGFNKIKINLINNNDFNNKKKKIYPLFTLGSIYSTDASGWKG